MKDESGAFIGLNIFILPPSSFIPYAAA